MHASSDTAGLLQYYKSLYAKVEGSKLTSMIQLAILYLVEYWSLSVQDPPSSCGVHLDRVKNFTYGEGLMGSLLSQLGFLAPFCK